MVVVGVAAPAGTNTGASFVNDNGTAPGLGEAGVDEPCKASGQRTRLRSVADRANRVSISTPVVLVLAAAVYQYILAHWRRPGRGRPVTGREGPCIADGEPKARSFSA